MKKVFNYKWLFLFVGSSLFFSCQNETEQALEESAAEVARIDVKWLAPDDHPVVQLLYSRGYEKGTIYETEEYFLAPPDLFYSKNIEDYHIEDTGGIPKQAYNTGKLVSLDRMRINVFLDNSIGTDLQTQSVNAINELNGINNCALFFVRVFNANQAHITIRSDFGVESTNVLGRAGFPSNGRPFNLVTLNVDRVDDFGADIRRNVVIHELGHCVGLRHTNWQANRESSAVNIPGTSAFDAGSIMWSSANGGTPFTNGDLTAFRALFPRALRMDVVNVIDDYDYSGEIYVLDEVYVDVFEDGSYTTTSNLNRNVTVNYKLRIQEYNHTSGTYTYNRSRTLTAGSNRYFIDEEEEECSPYQGETCTSEDVDITYAFSIL
ncbi:dual-action HEIGH metallo-peptidase [Kordia sp. SMS9]|uniref:M57 family metalloprotease n=1 Tax=Kordia sp. SMS9 TaxID=2282170 RepID=UPI000E0D4BDD|nr:M57 family metalloprotease [Kordia sp. SMS9]AXG72441.1 dual-action HEIGH metallo-peptidase [Kordia sp. SMS9]